MTYEERLAKAQAKMELLKAKMADIAEKAKAARAMRKEEIAAAIKAINADLDDLDVAIADEIAEAGAAIDKAMDDQADAIIGSAAAADENLRLMKERKDSKIYAIKLKAQMKAEALKEKLARRREERDKEDMQLYILDLLDYAECCQQVAFAAAIEADLTLLEAADAATEYIEKYGEIEEAPADEETAE